MNSDLGLGDKRASAIRLESVPLALCICLGLTIAVLPSLIWWPLLGQPVCIGDGDEMYMLAISSQGYFNHPTYLSDPTQAVGGTSLYRQLPLLPGELISWVLGLGPIGIDLVWRIWAGLSIAFTWYLLARHHVGNRWVVVALVAILLADGGLLGASLFVRQGINFASVMTGRDDNLFAESPVLHREWRIGTPALTMAFLLLYLWLLARARERPTALRCILAGLGFGLQFHVYPYYWTNACAALVLAMALDIGHRRHYVWTGLVGGLIGLPRIIFDAMLKQSTSTDWMIRTGKLVKVPRLADFSPPKMALVIAVIALIWIWTRRRDLIHLGAMAASGFVLFNSQVLTGLQVENYHWMYVWGPCLSFLLLLMVASSLPERGRWARTAFGCLLAFAVADVAAGLWLRAVEASRNRGTFQLVTTYGKYRDQRLGPVTARLAPNAVVAGDPLFIDFAAILENERPLDNYWVFLSPYVTDADLAERKALNAYLLGLDPAAPEASLRARLLSANWSGDAVDQERRTSQTLAAFYEVARDLDAALDRNKVRYVALAADQVPPTYLIRGWVCLQRGPYWQLWEHRPAVKRRDPMSSAGSVIVANQSRQVEST